MHNSGRLLRLCRTLAASIVCAAIFASAAMATPPSGVALNLILGRATLPPFDIQPDDSPFGGIQSENSTDVVIQHVIFNPTTGSTGWHTHPGPLFVTVVSGALTLYDGDDAACIPHTFTAGQGFVDPGFGHVHIARNESTTVPAELYASYLNVPPGGLFRLDAPNPGNCAFRGF
jgi:hypothetical protein